ncbi:hypothetical protein C8R44DRAFT_645742, partial [Mycena epipterygia]
QTFEAKALEKINAELDCGRLASVPDVHHFNEHANAIIMDDCWVESITLKELMITATPSTAVAREIGLAVGEFLGRFHSWAGQGHHLILFLLCIAHLLPQKITAWITYERIISTLTTDNFPAVALIPGGIPDSTLDAIRAIVNERIPEIYHSRETLTMGDFWTRNVLVSLRPTTDTKPTSLERVHIVDWECVQQGIAALDVGKFCARCTPWRCSSRTRRRPRLRSSPPS